MKILVDRNIEINAITHKTMLVSRSVKWGPDYHNFNVAQRVHFPPREDEAFRREQLPFLAALCASAKHGDPEFFSSHEIRMEKLRQRGRSEGYVGINLLRDIPIRNVPSPVQRSIVIAGDFTMGTTEDEQMEFFRSITDPRFLHIRKHTGEGHIDDAYHLWTAENSKLDAFLTMDKRFYRVMKQKSVLIGSPVLVASPEDLCGRLGLQPIDICGLAAETNPFA
jgi:hypothetical protein